MNHTRLYSDLLQTYKRNPSIALGSQQEGTVISASAVYQAKKPKKNKNYKQKKERKREEKKEERKAVTYRENLLGSRRPFPDLIHF